MLIDVKLPVSHYLIMNPQITLEVYSVIVNECASEAIQSCGALTLYCHPEKPLAASACLRANTHRPNTHRPEHVQAVRQERALCIVIPSERSESRDLKQSACHELCFISPP